MVTTPSLSRGTAFALRTPSSAAAPRLSPFVHARLAPHLRQHAFRTTALSLGFQGQQLRLLTSSRAFLASAPSSPPTPPAPSTKPESKEVAVEEKKDKAVAKKEEKKEKGTRMQRIWATVKKEASHYWHGTKLLGKEVRISARLLRRLVAGKKLTRREHRQVRRLSFLPLSSSRTDSCSFCSSSVLPRTFFDLSPSPSSSSFPSWNCSFPSLSSSSPTCSPRHSPTSSRRYVDPPAALHVYSN